MQSKNGLLFACFLVLFECTREIPSEERPQHTMEESQMQGNASEISTLSDKEKASSERPDRWNHARMRDLDTTTLGYDEWWFLTTPHRPFVSYRDFPGKSGVAIWKEISPGAPTDNRRSRKVSGPTAAGVSSRACITGQLEILQRFVSLTAAMVSLRYFYWTVVPS